MYFKYNIGSIEWIEPNRDSSATNYYVYTQWYYDYRQPYFSKRFINKNSAPFLLLPAFWELTY